MIAFLGTMAILFAFDIIGRVIRLKDGDHNRKPVDDAINAVGNTAILIWIVWLIASEVQP